MSHPAAKIARLLIIGCAMIGMLASSSAEATVMTTTNGLTTTYTENFNGQTDFSGGALTITGTGDDYLWLNANHPNASWTFSAAQPLSKLEISFWYSVPGDSTGKLQYANQIVSLSDTPGSQTQFDLNNPGASSGGGNVGDPFDAIYSGSVTNLTPGQYTITFSAIPFSNGHNTSYDGLKVDDLVLVATAKPDPTTAVSEPGSLAILGIGLLGFGLNSKRKRN